MGLADLKSYRSPRVQTKYTRKEHVRLNWGPAFAMLKENAAGASLGEAGLVLNIEEALLNLSETFEGFAA